MPMMRAALCTAYGGPEVIRLGSIPRPAPGPGEVLIRVAATTVSSGDHRLRALDVPRILRLPLRAAFGWRGPRRPILGTELAGHISAIGPNVTRWRVGDAVIAFPGVGMGAHAEYRTMPDAGRIVPWPEAMPADQAAALCFGGLTALWFLRDAARLAPSARLLVIGATGAVGSAAVQIGRALGASVDAVAGAANMTLARDLGAGQVFDHSTTDALATGQTWDAILDCAGTTTLARAGAALTPAGKLLMVDASPAQMAAAPFRRQLVAGMAPERLADMETLVRFWRSGSYRPLIGATFAFDDIANAHALAATRHKRGSAVVTVS